MQGLSLQNRIYFSRALVLAKFALCVYLLWRWLGGTLAWSEAATSCVSSWVSWEVFAASQVLLLLVPCLRPFGMIYKVICRCLPFVLGLEVPGTG